MESQYNQIDKFEYYQFNLKLQHSKQYANKKEEEEAESNFITTYVEVNAHNKRDNETFKRALTEDSDMSYSEKTEKRMGLNLAKISKMNEASKTIDHPAYRVKRSDTPLPLSVDYR